MLLKSGYDRTKKAAATQFRPITQDEARRAREYPLCHQIKMIDRNGCWRDIKITSVKTWKSRPDAVDVHWKYGLYEYGITSFTNGEHTSGAELVIAVAVGLVQPDK